MYARAFIVLITLAVSFLMPAGLLQQTGQPPQAPDSEALKDQRQGIDGSVGIAEETGPNCGRPDAHLTVSLIRWTANKKSEHGLRLEYVSDQFLNLKRFEAPLLLTVDNDKKVKPSFLPMSMNVEMGAGRASMDLLYHLAPKELATLAQAKIVEGRLSTPGGECRFAFSAEAPERIRKFLSVTAATR